jgi:hypothetical protein
VLRSVLEDSEAPLTRLDVLKLWPIDHAKPGSTTLHRWLERAFREGLVQRTGFGRTRHPYLFSLPEQGYSREVCTA